MRAFGHARRRHVELRHLRIKYRLLALQVATARLPANPRVVRGREDQRRYGVAADGVALDGDGLRRDHIHVEVDEGQIELIDQPVLRRQSEATLCVLLRHLHLVFHLHVEQAALPRVQLQSAPGPGCLHELERLDRKNGARQHGWLE